MTSPKTNISYLDKNLVFCPTPAVSKRHRIRKMLSNTTRDESSRKNTNKMRIEKLPSTN